MNHEHPGPYSNGSLHGNIHARSACTLGAGEKPVEKPNQRLEINIARSERNPLGPEEEAAHPAPSGGSGNSEAWSPETA